jgi:hypothetical protein
VAPDRVFGEAIERVVQRVDEEFSFVKIVTCPPKTLPAIIEKLRS